jgi:hypothetical protein
MHVILPAMLALLATWPAPAQAESLRCNGAIASEGDSKLSVLYKCGEPLLADSHCAPFFYPGSVYPAPPGLVGVPCQLVEEWLYPRGSGNLLATVRFRDGKVYSIRYGRIPE